MWFNMAMMRALAFPLVFSVLTGCALLMPALAPPEVLAMPSVSVKSRDALALQRPAGHVPYNIGIYNCVDTTGQNRKGAGGTADFSKAVPQDCAPFLIASFRGIPFYRVLERSRIDDVLRERQLATVMHGDLGKKILGVLHIADAVIMGQIVSYDRTASQAAGGLALSAIGGTRELVSDSFTFGLRLVSTKTGELIDDVIVKKTVQSIQLDGHVLRVIGVNMASVEYGVAQNEPVGIALQEAVDLAVRTLTERGITKGWLINHD